MEKLNVAPPGRDTTKAGPELGLLERVKGFAESVGEGFSNISVASLRSRLPLLVFLTLQGSALAIPPFEKGGNENVVCSKVDLWEKETQENPIAVNNPVFVVGHTEKAFFVQYFAPYVLIRFKSSAEPEFFPRNAIITPAGITMRSYDTPSTKKFRSRLLQQRLLVSTTEGKQTILNPGMCVVVEKEGNAYSVGVVWGDSVLKIGTVEASGSVFPAYTERNSKISDNADAFSTLIAYWKTLVENRDAFSQSANTEALLKAEQEIIYFTKHFLPVLTKHAKGNSEREAQLKEQMLEQKRFEQVKQDRIAEEKREREERKKEGERQRKQAEQRLDEANKKNEEICITSIAQAENQLQIGENPSKNLIDTKCDDVLFEGVSGMTYKLPFVWMVRRDPNFMRLNLLHGDMGFKNEEFDLAKVHYELVRSFYKEHFAQRCLTLTQKSDCEKANSFLQRAEAGLQAEADLQAVGKTKQERSAKCTAAIRATEGAKNLNPQQKIDAVNNDCAKKGITVDTDMLIRFFLSRGEAFAQRDHSYMSSAARADIASARKNQEETEKECSEGKRNQDICRKVKALVVKIAAAAVRVQKEEEKAQKFCTGLPPLNTPENAIKARENLKIYARSQPIDPPCTDAIRRAPSEICRRFIEVTGWPSQDVGTNVRRWTTPGEVNINLKSGKGRIYLPEEHSHATKTYANSAYVVIDVKSRLPVKSTVNVHYWWHKIGTQLGFLDDEEEGDASFTMWPNTQNMQNIELDMSPPPRLPGGTPYNLDKAEIRSFTCDF